MVAERSNTPPFRGGIEGDIFRIIIPMWCGDSNFPQVEEEAFAVIYRYAQLPQGLFLGGFQLALDAGLFTREETLAFARSFDSGIL